jgi:anti-sigma regulatory factor (Ser/Thr protein kinase)
MGETGWRDERVDDGPKLALSLPPRPQYLALVRRVTAAFAEHLGVREPTIGDLRTVVSEACSLAVSAGPPEAGAVRVEVHRDEEEFSIVVRERGEGLKQITAGDGDSLPLSLKVISTFSSHFEIAEHRTGETALNIRLPIRSGE